MSITNDRLGEQAIEVSKNIKEMGGTIKDAAAGKLGKLRENMSDRYVQGRDAAHSMISNCEQIVRDRPIQSVLIAAGIGLLFGRFWMRPGRTLSGDAQQG